MGRESKISDGSVVLQRQLIPKRLRALLKSRTLSSEESMSTRPVYVTCGRRRTWIVVWLHSVWLRKLAGSCLREG